MLKIIGIAGNTFKEVVRGAMAPVVIAGGPKMDSDERLLQMVKESVEAGGKGVSIGRNIFQHHDITGITRAVSGILLEGMEVEEALRLIKLSHEHRKAQDHLGQV